MMRRKTSLYSRTSGETIWIIAEDQSDSGTFQSNKLLMTVEAHGILKALPNETVLETLVRNGYYGSCSCAGNRTCGECEIIYEESVPLPTNEERKYLSADKLRQNHRLACCHVAKNKIKIKLLDKKSDVTVVFSNEKISEGSIQEPIVLIDLGTTTIAMELRDCVTGKLFAQYAAVNPQRKYGADVLTRINKARDGICARDMRQSVEAVLEAGLRYFERAYPIIRDESVCYLAGNTTMLHLLKEYNVEGLAHYPFAPVTLAEDAIYLESRSKKITLLPGISAFVGADIVADLYGIWALQSQTVDTNLRDTLDINQCTEQCEHNFLLIDLGTNCEMVLSYMGKIVATATSAGPAFEGGIADGVYGADLVHILAWLLDTNKMDETGLLKMPYFEDGIYICGEQINQPEKGFVLRQEDIRKLQLAKAAVAAGIAILCNKVNYSSDKNLNIYVAGGFGSYLRVEDAVKIGLFPSFLAGTVVPVKNQVLSGIFQYFRNKETCVMQEKNKKVQENLQKIEVINLANEPDFNEIYMEHINF